MEASFSYTSATIGAAQDWARRQGADWGVAAPHVTAWLQRGSELLGGSRTGRAVLCFDPQERLLSLDVWCDGHRVLGMDDLV